MPLSRSEDVSSIQLRQSRTFHTDPPTKTADYDLCFKKSTFNGLQASCDDEKRNSFDLWTSPRLRPSAFLQHAYVQSVFRSLGNKLGVHILPGFPEKDLQFATLPFKASTSPDQFRRGGYFPPVMRVAVWDEMVSK